MDIKVKRPKVNISAVITRADGTVEDLGIICDSELSEEEMEEFKKMIAEEKANG